MNRLTDLASQIEITELQNLATEWYSGLTSQTRTPDLAYQSETADLAYQNETVKSSSIFQNTRLRIKSQIPCIILRREV